MKKLLGLLLLCACASQPQKPAGVSDNLMVAALMTQAHKFLLWKTLEQHAESIKIHTQLLGAKKGKPSDHEAVETSLRAMQSAAVDLENVSASLVRLIYELKAQGLCDLPTTDLELRLKAHGEQRVRPLTEKYPGDAVTPAVENFLKTTAEVCKPLTG